MLSLGKASRRNYPLADFTVNGARGERHILEAALISDLQQAVREDDNIAYKRYQTRWEISHRRRSGIYWRSGPTPNRLASIAWKTATTFVAVSSHRACRWALFRLRLTARLTSQ